MTHTSKRFLTVGSLLRPKELLDYKTQIEHRDDIQYPFYEDFDGYKEVEDKAVATIVKKELEHDFPEITDGEYSKSMWHLDFPWGFKGIRRYIKDQGYLFREKEDIGSFETRRDIGLEVTEKIDGHNHPFIEHFNRLKELAPEDAALKVCIPSPGHMFTESSMDETVYNKVYETKEAYQADFIQAYKDFLKEYAEAGGKVIQFDDCLWQLFAEDNEKSPFGDSSHFNAEKAKEEAQAYIDINNGVIDYAHTLGLKVYTHNCRGNYASRSMSDGSYQAIADFFLKQQKYDRFYLEWDDARAGSLSALEAFKDKPETEVVLGLLSSKTAELDDKEQALKALNEAAKYIPKENLYLSHQCGFASCDGGNELTPENEWDKIKQGQRIAYEFWGE